MGMNIAIFQKGKLRPKLTPAVFSTWVPPGPVGLHFTRPQGCARPKAQQAQLRAAGPGFGRWIFCWRRPCLQCPLNPLL